MEKDLNINKEGTDTEVKEPVSEKQNQDHEEKNDETKEITPEERIKELEDKVARTFAEMENQRRRFLRNDDILKNTEALKKTLEHFDIINKDMVSILEKNGITPIDSIGKKLDPNLHQAMMEIDDDQKEPGTIIQEIQKGFMMKDRLLRPSLVGVSKKTEKKEEKSEENKENSDNQ